MGVSQSIRFPDLMFGVAEMGCPVSPGSLASMVLPWSLMPSSTMPFLMLGLYLGRHLPVLARRISAAHLKFDALQPCT
jgi:hypothetical protein